MKYSHHKKARLRVALAFVVFAIALIATLQVGSSQDPSKAWRYKQSSGELLLGETKVGEGYSGHDDGLNNPDKESVRDVGPIPRGEWSIGEAFKHKSKGPTVMRLTPVGHKAHGRDAFLIHGDNPKMDKSASNGCIILPPKLREQISKSGVAKLVVEK